VNGSEPQIHRTPLGNPCKTKCIFARKKSLRVDGHSRFKLLFGMSDPENNLKAPRKLLNASRGFFMYL